MYNREQAWRDADFQICALQFYSHHLDPNVILSAIATSIRPIHTIDENLASMTYHASVSSCISIQNSTEA